MNKIFKRGYQGPREFDGLAFNEDIIYPSIHDMTFRRCSFSRCLWERTFWQDVVFEECRFYYVNMSNSHIRSCVIRDSWMEGIVMDHIHIHDTKFLDTYFGVNSGRTLFRNVDFRGSWMRNAHLEMIHSWDVTWPETDLIIPYPPYTIHLQHDRITVGCQSRSPEEWRAMTRHRFLDEVSPDLVQYDYFKTQKDELCDKALTLKPYDIHNMPVPKGGVL